MNSVEFARELVESKFQVLKTEVVDQYQISFEVTRDDVHRLLSMLKQAGWIQLSYLSAIDWLEDNEFELVYIVMNWDKALHIQVRTRIDREHPEMDSVLSIFPGCKYYERECHEFFGVKFPGNPDFEKQLILEEWDDIPPLRKDFDPRAYSDAHFAKREYEDRHTVLNNQSSKQKQREARKERITTIGKGGRK
ncbi:NADH-quinone oxidoreductase subunit C [Candidatus Xianfuyuplasma coldseepsis]|uniref:NADH-quinone oxidoreductase subunit C n=1 Tax=Candidatus Xianfuyuplasma coldseepsis TaxID=2782163 RepID=A0A7L7KU58_9MOLU|nr:NADH-quinone oxidoreductase subunit C [Xianfuyuplasma coldseepsis]QMS85949.1 NADH-quinone oxidoreductase subunit C [Xianfuyuplasma coldseepsis]